MKSQVEIKNKKATFEYHIIDTLEAGIQLQGTEIKALREGAGNIKEAYCIFRKGELWVKSMRISEYSKGTNNNHDPMRVRKLLLRKKELRKLQAKVKEKGYTIIPLRLFINERGFAKVDIALVTGKKYHDKRESIKRKDTKRDLQRIVKYSG